MGRHGSSYLVLALLCTACAGATADDTAKPVPEYNRETGRLERLVADRNNDGKPDTWAQMDGIYTIRIDIDQNGDGKPDRAEFYAKDTTPGARTPSVIERAEERGGGADAIVRREFYKAGILERSEEDTDSDGRMDKWEFHTEAGLSRIDLDLTGRGVPSRRLIYGAGGAVRVEVDPDGDGIFVPAPPNGK